MRLVAGVAVIAHGIEGFQTGHAMEPVILDIVALGCGTLLIAGLWTPITGSLVAIVALWGSFAQHALLWPSILLATMGAALALLGPGVWSLDAWLFGWKRIDIPFGPKNPHE